MSMKFKQSEKSAGRHSLLASLLAVAFLFVTCFVQTGYAQSSSASGTIVSSSDNLPLPGVNVLIKGTTNGTITDMDGKFSMSVENGATLVVSFIGFETQEVVYNGQPLNIVLVEEASDLDEVVVVGYGVQKKKLNTGATVQVKGDDIAKLNTTNPLQAMQGQTPGVNIASTSGQPGSDMKVTIRGLGTIGNSGPLYLIDGVGGDISTLNPADIESIDVLKDAASAAIYGAQAANGVVLITTKGGKEGKSQISFDAYYGVQTVARKMELLDAKEYMTIMDEQALNSGSAAFDWYGKKADGTYMIEGIHDADGNIYDSDWVDEMLKDNAQTQSYSLSITGGSKISTYAMSMGYMSQEGVVGGKDVSNYERYNFRINSEHKVWEDILKVGEQVSFVYKLNNGISVGNQYNNTLRGAFGVAPIHPIYSDNNIFDVPYNDTSESTWNSGDGNPYGLMMVNTNNENKNMTFTGNVYAELEPIKNLKLKTLFGAVYGSSEYRSFTPLYQFSEYSYNTEKTSVNQNMNTSLGMTWTNTLSYNFNISDHAFSVLAGMEAYRYQGTYVGGGNSKLKEGYEDWEHAYLSNATGTSTADNLSASGNPHGNSRSVSYFGRLGWNWKETYMLNATVRCDGSSKFKSGERYGIFPSVSAGWVMTNEQFLASLSGIVDFLKLRVSWGQVGNANISDYQYLAPVKSTNTHYYFGTGAYSDEEAASVLGNNWGAYPSRLANPEVTWETSQQTNIGIDARFLDSRLGLNFDFYIKDTKDWLVEAPILATVGAGAPYINGGSVKNTGLELALTWNDEIGDFKYSIGANGAYNKNEVGDIPTADGMVHGQNNQLYDNSPEFYRAENGKAIGYFYGYKVAGIFQNQADIDNWIAAGNGVKQSDVMPGDVKYYDINHDGAIDDNDKVDLGNGMPDFTFGFNVSLNYKGFDLSVVASGAAGQEIVQSYRNHSSKTANYTTAILDRWTGEGTSNFMPRVTEQNINWEFSDLYIHEGDYMRISNITLGYDFAKLVGIKKISQLRLYGQVQNVFTFTKYDGMDPEIGYGVDGWVSGIDLGYYPRPRTMLVGLNIKF